MNSQVGDYDESSIITAYTDTNDLDYISETGLVTVNPDTLSGTKDAKQVSPDEQIPVPKTNVRTYKVVEHDDIIKISKKFDIAAEVILWSNGLSMDDTLIE